MLELFLVTQQSGVGTEILVWVVGILLLLLAVALYFWQRKQGQELSSELSQLEKVKKHNVEYEFVLKAMRLCTWHIDAQARTITYDNDYRERSDCFSPVPGTTLDQLVDVMADADKMRIAKSLEEICTGKKDEYHEISQVQIAHSDKYYWTESYATVASRDTEGLPLTIVGTSMRIDERKAMETALVEARNRAEESDRLKSAFIANMSHEIRTPLNAIIGFTSVLPDVQGDEERRELINLIQENNQKLLRIIDDVMNISKIESGKEQLVMTTFDLNDVLRSVVDSYTPKAQPGVTLSTMFAQGSQTVTTDLGRLTEVMNHLLSNATKFTSQGRIIVGYDAPVNKRISIWVQDTGKGIAPEHLERVFERFFKVDEYIPGAGLGLSICRTMAYSMGGDVTVESQLGEGSKFRVEIPV
ncbi:MAG: HAMP domain-containing histidine kinase [Prevotella sp.]|nr:HAMP domain-containing histidine kinase [Prevotella sp.]